MEFSTLIFEEKEQIATITLNAPKRKNALVAQMKTELAGIVKDLKHNDSVKVVVITGGGDAFCAGGDLSSMGKGMNVIAARARMKKLHDWVSELISLEKPVIAAVNGAAVGAGMSLALLADIIIASEKAVLGAPFNKVGLVPDAGMLYLLPRYVGMLKAKELIFTGKLLKAEEALQLGLVNKVVPHDQLLESTYQLAKKIAGGPTRAIGLAKEMLNTSFENDLQTTLAYEAFSQAIAYQTADHAEGVKAFFAKRDPLFKGE